MKWSWCSPCALVWVIIGSSCASNVWLNVHWTYSIAAVLVLIPAIAVFIYNEREDVHDAAQSIVAEIWLLFVGWRKPREGRMYVGKQTQE